MCMMHACSVSPMVIADSSSTDQDDSTTPDSSYTVEVALVHTYYIQT